MALTPFNDNLSILAPKSLDAKYTKFVGGLGVPHNDVAEANSRVLSVYRHIGLTQLVLLGGIPVEYWYRDGIADGDLIPKAQVEIDNTDSLVLSGTGVPGSPITGDVQISAEVDNTLQLLTDGLYVPPGTGGGGGDSYTNEMAQDAVGTILTDSSSIDFTYNDAANTITASVIDSYVRGLLSGSTGISYNSTTGAISTTITQYTDEQAQDAVGTILTDSSSIDFTYNDGSNTITAVVIDSYIRGLLSGGTGISYNSTTGAITSTITQYTDALARLAISATTPIVYNNTTGVITHAASGVSAGTYNTLTVDTFGHVTAASNTSYGTVTSVGLSMPTGFSVGSSPVTTSGTIAVTTTLNGVLIGNGSGFSTATIGSGLTYSSSTLSWDGVTGRKNTGSDVATRRRLNFIEGSNVTIDVVDGGTDLDITIASTAAGGGGGSVTSFSAGNLSPLFTTSVATATTTPALSFTLSNAAANTYYGNATGSTGAPSFTAAGALTKTNDTNVTLTLGGSPTVSLLAATSLTLGWTGQLAIARGGTNASTANDAFNNLAPSQSGNSGKTLVTDGTNTSWGYSNGYIINQFASAQSSADYWIDGRGRINTYLGINSTSTTNRLAVSNINNTTYQYVSSVYQESAMANAPLVGALGQVYITNSSTFTQTTQAPIAATYGSLVLTHTANLTLLGGKGVYAGSLGQLAYRSPNNATNDILSGVMSISTLASTGSITHLAGLRVLAPLQEFGQTTYSGTVTNFYGLHIGDIAYSDLIGQITNKWAIYQEGANDTSFFKGNLVFDKIKGGSTLMVTVDTSGNISSQAIPSSGTGTVTSVGLTSSDITVGGSSPITTSGTFTLTLPTVNSNVGTFNNVTVNAKGLVTAASNVSYLTSYTETDPLALKITSNLSDLNNAGTARTNLGITGWASNLITTANPSAVRFIKINADNTITLRTAAELLSDIGAGTGSGTVTSVTSANGDATVATTTTTPVITIVSAPKLTTARNINGVAFDGTSNITVTAAAGTLTGTTLNSSVVTSSLTSVGTIGTGVWQGTAIADTYISSASNWNTAYSERNQWDGGATGLTASTGRTSLGGTTVGQNIFTATNPSAVRWIRVNADNTVTFRTAAETLGDIGGISSYTETDPIFGASAAAGITGTQVSHWDTAYGWGNHASAGYEVQSNKATTFGTLNNTLYPTTQAVANYVTGLGYTTNTGTVTSVAASVTGSTALSISGSPVTTSGTLAFSWTGSSGQYIKGDGTLATFPTIPSAITINNNADYRVITGSNTSNTLNGETYFTWNGQYANLTTVETDVTLSVNAPTGYASHLRLSYNAVTYWQQFSFDGTSLIIESHVPGTTITTFEFTDDGIFRAADDVVGFYSFSDRRLKTNIQYLSNEEMLRLTTSLKPVTYQWEGKLERGTEYGLIAQDVEEIAPFLVKEEKRVGKSTKYKRVDYDKITAINSGAIQALEERIKKLEALLSKQ